MTTIYRSRHLLPATAASALCVATHTAVVLIALLLGACAENTPAIGEETIPADEAEHIAEVIERFKTQIKQRDGTGNTTRRGAHPKHHGCVKAEFRVSADLKPALSQGLFQPGASYPALIRFSNNADPQADHKPDVRGMAIKLFETPGTKLFQPDAAASTHDFLLVTHPVFLFPDVATYTKAFVAFDEDRALSFFFNPLDNHLKSFLIVRKMLAQHDNLLAERWFSMVPYRFGEHAAVKYSARSCAAIAPRDVPERDDFLRERLAADLGTAAACFEFQVQFQTDPGNMPIENPSVAWSEQQSKPQTLARLHIPAQQFDTPQQQQNCENLSFNPWRALPEHQPLGGISRARRVIYEQLAAFRRQRNKLPETEPDSPAWLNHNQPVH